MKKITPGHMHAHLSFFLFIISPPKSTEIKREKVVSLNDTRSTEQTQIALRKSTRCHRKYDVLFTFYDPNSFNLHGKNFIAGPVRYMNSESIFQRSWFPLNMEPVKLRQIF